MATRRPQQEKKSLLSAISGSGWLITIVVGGLFNTGMTYQQFSEVKKNQETSSTEQKVMSAKLAEFRENQVRGLQDIATLKTSVTAIDNRVLVIERIFIEQPKREGGRK